MTLMTNLFKSGTLDGWKFLILCHNLFYASLRSKKLLDLGLHIPAEQHNPAHKGFLFPALWALSVTIPSILATQTEAVRVGNVHAEVFRI